MVLSLETLLAYIFRLILQSTNKNVNKKTLKCKENVIYTKDMKIRK